MKLNVLQLITEMAKFILYGITIQLFLVSFLIASDSNGQEVKSIRDVFIDVSHQNASLIEVFRHIEEKTRYTFAYDQSAIEKDKKITISQSHISVADLLMEVSKSADLKFKQVEGRLAHWLLRNCPEACSGRVGTIELQMSKRILASQLGVTSETLSRTLAKFRDQKLIRVDGRIIEITNGDGLQAHLGGALTDLPVDGLET